MTTLLNSALSLGSAIGARQVARSIHDVRMNDVLGLIGLARRRSAVDKVLPAVGWFGLGTVLGAGAALMLAPSSGKQLRARVSHQLDEAKHRVQREVHSLSDSISETARTNG